MPWRTVKSSLQGWSKLSSSANPSVPALSSPAIHPFTHLYLCLSDEDKGKHSLTCTLTPSAPQLSPSIPPSLLSSSLGLFRRDLQAWLAIVTWPHGGKTGTHKQTYTRPGTQTHALMHPRTCSWEEDGGQFCWVVITLRARPPEKRWGVGVGGWRMRDFCLF